MTSAEGRGVPRGEARDAVQLRGAGARAHGRVGAWAEAVRGLRRVGPQAPAAAAKGHAAAAAVALDWGAPVLSTAISAVDRDGPSYRGRSAWTLAEQDTPFEVVARGLWTGFEPWPSSDVFVDDDPSWEGVLDAAPSGRVSTAWLLAMARSEAEARDPEVLMARLMRATEGSRPGQGRIAERLVACFDLSPDDVGVVERALVICADHELNASTFAARVAASTGASLPGAVLAALGAFLGPRHGQQPLDVSARLDEATDDPKVAAAQAIAGRVRGFGHPLYPEGDPRAEALLGWVANRSEAQAGLRWIAAMQRAGAPPPSLDVGLVVLARALGAPADFAVTVFGLGRAAGWIAHALEQRDAAGILRPRARYVGP